MAEHELSRDDNPKEIASYLIREFGIEKAVEIAMDGVANAKASRDNYQLSVWREIRSLLRSQQ